MNVTAITGRLVSDPKIFTVKNGELKTAKFTIAAKDNQGNTDFPNIECLGKQAEFVEKYMKKGRMIAVQGKVSTSKYTNKKGETVYDTHIKATSVFAEDDKKPTENVAYTEEIDDEEISTAEVSNGDEEF